MLHVRKVQWFRREDAPVAPDLAMADCVPPGDMGCVSTDTGGCNVTDYCTYDYTTCGGVYDYCEYSDRGGGCLMTDRCHTDGWGECVFDSCSFDDPYCAFLDYGSS